MFKKVLLYSLLGMMLFTAIIMPFIPETEPVVMADNSVTTPKFTDLVELNANVIKDNMVALQIEEASKNFLPSGRDLIAEMFPYRPGELYLEPLAKSKWGDKEWILFKAKLTSWCEKEGYNPNHFMCKIALETSPPFNPKSINWGTDKNDHKYMRAVGLNQMTSIARKDAIDRGWLPKGPVKTASAYLELAPHKQLDYIFQYFKLMERDYANLSHKINPDASYGKYRHLPIKSVADMHLVNLYPEAFMKNKSIIADPRKSDWQRKVANQNPGLQLPSSSRCPSCITRWSHKRWIKKFVDALPSHPDVVVVL